MRIRNNKRAALGVLGGAALAAALAPMVAPEAALAKPKGGALRLIDINVGGLAGIHQNAIIELTFTSAVDPRSVNPAVFQVREQNAKGAGFTKQIPGSFQTVGSFVRFYPRLPTHLRDPLSPTSDFYGFNTALDNADANAALKPSKNYEIKVLGGPVVDAMRGLNGRRLAKQYTARFSTTAVSPKDEAFTIDTYSDSPPPAFLYSNPSDKVASAADQYARHGGTREVPNDLSISLYGKKVPLNPSALRAPGNVTLRLTERYGDPKFAKPIPGNAFVEQNFDSTTLVFKPLFPLPDRGTYALKVTKDVHDLTDKYDFESNAERLRLRSIYEFMEAAQALSPLTPPEQLPDPDDDLIGDWPLDPTERGVLKRNILDLGRAYPTEVDPRVMILFSTRDEPISKGAVVMEFVKSDGLANDSLSTATYDTTVPGAAAAIFTAAGGSGVNGDYTPALTNETINIDSYPNRTISWRKVRIPVGYVVNITGTRPATINCLDFVIDGELRSDGSVGGAASTTAYYSLPGSKPPTSIGGAGATGGGKGGDSNSDFGQTGYNGIGRTGNAAIDSQGITAIAADGGQGGLGGRMATGSVYGFGGAGGGGGARTAGSTGASAAPPGAFYASWAGSGGAGGAGSSNDDLQPLVGGAGGGAGGNGFYYPQSTNWAKAGGAGGGGGGALLIQTSSNLTINSTGAIRARGGVGGAGTGAANTLSAGPGGGGGGGSILLRSSIGFTFANAATAFDVRGGAGGTQTGSYVASPGGTGGTGYIRTEDPNGGTAVTGGTGGSYDPVGGGVPSFVYTNWVDTGVDGPRFVNFTDSDFKLSAAGNDALLIEIQAAVENTSNFGTPLLTALDANQNTTNSAIVSPWIPVRVVDLTGNPSGAFGPIGSYTVAANGNDYIFPISSLINDRNYKFFRVRIRFQLDGTQSVRDAVPYVDQLKINFEFNL